MVLIFDLAIPKAERTLESGWIMIFLIPIISVKYRRVVLQHHRSQQDHNQQDELLSFRNFFEPKRHFLIGYIDKAFSDLKDTFIVISFPFLVFENDEKKSQIEGEDFYLYQNDEQMMKGQSSLKLSWHQ